MKQLVVMVVSGGILLLLGALFAVQVMHEELGISQPKPLMVEETERKVAVSQAPLPDSTNELKVKYEKKEQVGRSNFFSDLGNSLAQFMSHISRSFLSLVMSFVENVLNGE